MNSSPEHTPWPATFAEAREVQLALRGRLLTRPPTGFAPRLIAGADVSAARFSRTGYAGIVVIDARTMETVDRATAVVTLRMPYVPGYLSFRELPALSEAWARLTVRPDVVVFDGQGYAHPRRFGLACHGGVHFGVPAVGCAKTLLVGTHRPLAEQADATAELVDGGEVVGVALRTRTRVRPVYVSAGHAMDLATALEVVRSVTGRWRLPETTRRAHALVNAARRAESASQVGAGAGPGLSGGPAEG
jgi:deoxyribonuclease V